MSDAKEVSTPDGHTRYRTYLFVYTTAVISLTEHRNMHYSLSITLHNNTLHDIVEYSANLEYSAKSLSTYDDISMDFNGNYNQLNLLI